MQRPIGFATLHEPPWKVERPNRHLSNAAFDIRIRAVRLPRARVFKFHAVDVWLIMLLRTRFHRSSIMPLSGIRSDDRFGEFSSLSSEKPQEMEASSMHKSCAGIVQPSKRWEGHVAAFCVNACFV